MCHGLNLPFSKISENLLGYVVDIHYICQMKFAIERTISYTHKDRVKILTADEDYFNQGNNWAVKYMAVALIKVTSDFDLEKKFNIIGDTDSVQYRPKGIFKNSKGYFIKNKKTVYLTDDEVADLLKYITKAKKHIKAKL